MTTKNLTLEHLVKPSKNTTTKAPVIIMLHGYGSNENDLFSFASELPEEYLIVSAKAPLSLMPYGNAWYEINFDADQNKFTNNEQAIASRKRILKFIDEVVEHYHADANKVTLLGFSQGAILSYAAALSAPQKVQRVIALSGYIDSEIFNKSFRDNSYKNLAIFASHGSVDQVIPVDWARKIKPFLTALNITHEYHEYPVGHGVCPQNFSDLKNWLLKTA